MEAFKGRDQAADLAEKETELLAVKAANEVLMAEIQEQHGILAETIRNNWKVLKATVESFQCEEIKPCTFPLF